MFCQIPHKYAAAAMVHRHGHRTEAHPTSQTDPQICSQGSQQWGLSRELHAVASLERYSVIHCKTLMDNKHSTACSASMVSLLRAKKSHLTSYVSIVFMGQKSGHLLLPCWFTIKSFILVTDKQQLLLEGNYQGQNNPGAGKCKDLWSVITHQSSRQKPKHVSSLSGWSPITVPW